VFSSGARVSVEQGAEFAGWQAVAAAILNLSETITRE
jgi:hypothetical protein